MPEKMPLSPEHRELMEVPEEHLLKYEKHGHEDLRTGAEKIERQRKNLEYLKKQAESQAKSREELRLDEPKEKPEKFKPVGQEQKDKSGNYQATLSKVRSKLGPSSRSFSEFIHNPSVETASELASKTVARPSSIIGGGLAALLGSGLVLFMAKHYGFEYNYFVFFGFFIIGFFTGLIVEFSFKALRKYH